jgi:hypothetical protein
MIDLSTTRMISVREVADIDAETLALYEQQEALLRDGSGFLLYLLRRTLIGSTEERLIRVAAREALVWLNERPECTGSVI